MTRISYNFVKSGFHATVKNSHKSGRSTPVNRRAVRITLDNAFRSDSVMLPNHTIIDPVSILSIIGITQEFLWVIRIYTL